MLCVVVVVLVAVLFQEGSTTSSQPWRWPGWLPFLRCLFWALRRRRRSSERTVCFSCSKGAAVFGASSWCNGRFVRSRFFFSCHPPPYTKRWCFTILCWLWLFRFVVVWKWAEWWIWLASVVVRPLTTTGGYDVYFDQRRELDFLCVSCESRASVQFFFFFWVWRMGCRDDKPYPSLHIWKVNTTCNVDISHDRLALFCSYSFNEI